MPEDAIIDKGSEQAVSESAPEVKAEAPAPVTKPTDEDPYKLYEGLSDQVVMKKAMDARRNLPRDVRAALDAATNATMRNRLTRQAESLAKKSGKYTDEDVNKIRADLEAEYKSKYHPQESDAEFQKFLGTFEDEGQRETVKKLAEFWKGETKQLKSELEQIKSPFERAEAQRQLDEQKREWNSIVEKVMTEVPHINPLTVIDILKENAGRPEDERMTVDEVVMVAQELNDEMFNDILPKRLQSKDKYTLDNFSKTLDDAIGKNEPWAVELANSIITRWKDKKLGVVADTVAPEGTRPPEITKPKKKYSPLDFITGKAAQEEE